MNPNPYFLGNIAGEKIHVNQKMKKVLVSVIASFLVMSGLNGCAVSKTSSSRVAVQKKSVRVVAIAPGTGVLGDAVSVELFNRGFNVVDANQTAAIVGSVGMTEFEVTTRAGFKALAERQIDAVITGKAVAAVDNTPESASVRVVSTMDGSLVAGVTWQNGFAGARGSPADRLLRKNLTDAAAEIAKEITNHIEPANRN